MPRDEIKEYQAQIDRLREAEREKDWIHHVADFSSRGGEVTTRKLDRPFLPDDRIEAISVIDASIGKVVLDLPERRLTPRAPYQGSPLSYLEAFERSWTLTAQTNRLEWADFGDGVTRHGEIRFWFRNVVAGSKALVTIEVTASSTGQGTTGELEVRSSDAGPRTFPVTGFGDHTLDVLVQPDDSFATLVSLEVKSGIDYLVFKEITYNTI